MAAWTLQPEAVMDRASSGFIRAVFPDVLDTLFLILPLLLPCLPLSEVLNLESSFLAALSAADLLPVHRQMDVPSSLPASCLSKQTEEIEKLTTFNISERCDKRCV